MFFFNTRQFLSKRLLKAICIAVLSRNSYFTCIWHLTVNNVTLTTLILWRVLYLEWVHLYKGTSCYQVRLQHDNVAGGMILFPTLLHKTILEIRCNPNFKDSDTIVLEKKNALGRRSTVKNYYGQLHFHKWSEVYRALACTTFVEEGL